MTMSDTMKHGETDLDRLFAEARSDLPEPSAALLARVLTDAEALQPDTGLSGVRKGAGIGALILSLFGGWGGIGGLATAAVTGIWLGVGLVGQSGDFVGSAFGLTDTSASSVTQRTAVLPDSDILALAGE